MAADLRTITEIRGRRGTALRTIFLDGERWRDIASPVLKELGFAIGDAVNPDDLDERARVLEPPAARVRAYRLLAYRERSSAELGGRLIADGYPATLVAELVADLAASGLVDDVRYAEALGRGLVSLRGFGRQRALREMERKGIDQDVAAAVLDELAPADDEPTRAVAEAQRLARPGDSASRLAARLARRGFRPADALRAAEQVLLGAGEGFDDSV